VLLHRRTRPLGGALLLPALPSAIAVRWGRRSAGWRSAVSSRQLQRVLLRKCCVAGAAAALVGTAEPGAPVSRRRPLQAKVRLPLVACVACREGGAARCARKGTARTGLQELRSIPAGSQPSWTRAARRHSLTRSLRRVNLLCQGQKAASLNSTTQSITTHTPQASSTTSCSLRFKSRSTMAAPKKVRCVWALPGLELLPSQ
jgi:hypothetical protein